MVKTQAHARPIRLSNAEVYTGTCSWTKGFEGWYPPHLRTSSAGRLAHYASHFPAVEIDSTYYALPRPDQATLLARRTPQGFLFGVKAFGPLTGHPTDPGRLPEPALLALPQELRSAERLWPRDLPREATGVRRIAAPGGEPGGQVPAAGLDPWDARSAARKP